MSSSRPSEKLSRSIASRLDDSAFWADLQSAKEGDLAALDSWACKLSEELMSEIESRRQRRKVKGTHGSSELVQDTVTRIRNGSIIFPGSTYKDFKRWAKVVIFRRRLEWARNATAHRDERHLREIVRQLSAREEGVESREATTEELDRIQKTMVQLKAHEQQVIRFRIFEELTFGQIGELHHQSEDGARKAYDRAIAKLRRMLSGNG